MLFIALVVGFVGGLVTSYFVMTTDNPASRFVETKAANRKWTLSTDAMVTYPAKYVGSVYLTLWLPEDALPVDATKVTISWGSYKAKVNITDLTNEGVVLYFDKRNAEKNPAELRVRTSVPVRRMATIADEYPAMRHIEVSGWKES